MDTEATTHRKVHHGHNVKHLREILGMKQDVLAEQIGLAQQTFSRIEDKEKLPDELLEKIAKEMNLPVEVLKNYDEEKAINIISNTFQEETSVGSDITQYNKCTFNPLDKVVELYDQIIKEKNERISFLEQLLKKQKH